MARLEKSSQDGWYRLQGELTFSTVPKLFADSEPLLAAGSHVQVDLAEVVRADSAGLALLAEWVRLAAHGKRAIDYMNTPTQVRALAHVSGLDKILPFDGAPGAQ